MADNSANKITTDSVGTSAETSWLLTSVNQVAVRNTHASQRLAVRVFTASTPAAAKALADATDAVLDADENWNILAGQRVVVYKSPRARCVAVSIIGSGSTTTYTVEGTDWFD
jgi:hypothetical protein